MHFGRKNPAVYTKSMINNKDICKDGIEHKKQRPLGYNTKEYVA